MESGIVKERSYKKTRASPKNLAAQASGPSGGKGHTTEAEINTPSRRGQKETSRLKWKVQMVPKPGSQAVWGRRRQGWLLRHLPRERGLSGGGHGAAQQVPVELLRS